MEVTIQPLRHQDTKII